METTMVPTFPASPTNINDLVAPYYNHSYLEEQDTLWKRISIVTLVISSTAFVLGVIGNGLVIFITGFHMKKTVNTVWFLNLAIADFTFISFLPLNIVSVALGFHWPFGQAMCKISSTLAFLNLYASVYLLMVISVDRCISVRCPVWAQNHRTPRRAAFVALGIWILALVLCSPSLHFRDTMPQPHNEGQIMCYNHYGNTQEQMRSRDCAMVISRFIFGFVIPLGVIVACYGAIVLRLRRNRLAQSGKPFKVLTAAVIAFFVCWFPYHVFSFLDLKSKKQGELPLVLAIGVPLASSLAFINSCINPILYVFVGQDFKMKLRHTLLSAFQIAFAEENNQDATNTKDKSAPTVEFQL